MGRDDPARGGLIEYHDGTIGDADYYILIHDDGTVIEPIRDAKDRIEQAKGLLWSRIGPLEFHGVEVKRGTKLYDTEREQHLRAEAVDIDHEGYPWVTFQVINSWPHEFVEFTGEQIAQRIDEGVLKSQQQIHEDVEDALGVEL